jgi:hypothetical protein
MKTLTALCVLLLAGCQTLSRETIAYEATYQALHVIDTVQTLNIKNHRNGRLIGYESNPVLGKSPSDSDILTYMVAEAATHAMITFALDRAEAPLWLQRSWHIGSIGWNGRLVVMNYKMGL